ncbi:DUF551 domain-containing protein [Enterobacter kobei]|uniref:DUF551 domain-containing protein n=1 Tax=Enterobacter kobei TaxID=208224 RepID=UPI003ED905D4
MSTITTERLTKILSETQAVISECNSRCVHGSVEVNARLFENVLMELLRHRAAMLQGADGNSPVIPDGWVACSERMPEQFVEVLACTEGGGRYVAALNQEMTWDDGDFFDDIQDVTHWMPLPTPPQK